MTKFVADHMLGTLAKWLRILGYDTLYPKEFGDEKFLDIARRDERVLLTMDKEIAKRKISRGVKIVTVREVDVRGQLREVFSALAMAPDPAKILSRCSVCNSEIAEVAKELACGNVPDGVYEQQDRFWKCPGCGRFYWEGTHRVGILKTAKGLGTEQRDEKTQM
jgi:hypothetical protein